MNWFGGQLIIKCIRGRTTVHHDVSLTRAQELIDAQPAGNIVEAMYHPYPTSMGHSSGEQFAKPGGNL